jgi:hypothetical protein
LSLFIYILKINKMLLTKYMVNIWGLGIGDWGLGIGDWGLGPIPNPHKTLKQLKIKLFN